ncbi:MAG: hypothetical protein J6039_04295 [Alphaproteobacteria bacterium]|nr:hypothetical protein [Alphaproteobacteria bacterium]
MKDDLGFEDDFDVFANKVISELKEKMTPEQYDEFLKESEKFIESLGE